MVDTLVLGTSTERCESSSLSRGTKLKGEVMRVRGGRGHGPAISEKTFYILLASVAAIAVVYFGYIAYFHL